MKMESGTRAIDKLYRRRDRYEIPDWQREEVWEDAKKALLIDSVLRGWKLPKFYFLKVGTDEYEVVDGQQRLTAIFEFFSGDLELSKKSAERFGATKYAGLPSKAQDAFDDFEIEFDVIEDADEREIKEFFQRLQAGLPLTSSEKLNSVHSNLRDFARKLAKHSFLNKKISVTDKRLAHFDIVAKVAAIELEGLDAGLRFDDLKGTFESLSTFSSRSQVAKRLQSGFDYLNRVFPTRSSMLRHRTVVQSFATLAMRLVACGNGAGYEPNLRRFFEAFSANLSKQVELGAGATDVDLIAFQRSINANVKSGTRTRHAVLMRKLFEFDPTAIGLFEPSTVAESGLSAALKSRAAAIVDLVASANSQYSALNGSDLFKATNKTTTALAQLGKALNDYEDYKRFIENLYFLFHEGTGSRLGKNTPKSFADISLLRTGLQHDVDHGPSGKVKQKNKAIGQAFSRYSGVASPEGLDPERFILVQSNLLAAVEQDLQVLNKSL